MAFAGGVGLTNEELCGALVGGLLVIGAMHGRTDPRASDDRCMHLAAAYRERFLEHFGHIRCADLKEHWIGKKDQETCAELAADAAGVLMDVLGGKKKFPENRILPGQVSNFQMYNVLREIT